MYIEVFHVISIVHHYSTATTVTDIAPSILSVTSRKLYQWDSSQMCTVDSLWMRELDRNDCSVGGALRLQQ